MKFRYEFMTLTQIGSLFNVSSHQVGKWLVEIGLRTDTKKPSTEAFEGGYVKAAPSRGDGYNWAWQSEKTVKALEAAGHKLSVEPASELLMIHSLKGPFAQSSHPSHGNEIVNADGTTSIWVVGLANAELVCAVLNAAHRSGLIKDWFKTVIPLTGAMK